MDNITPLHNESEQKPARANGLSIALGLLVWGVCFLLFPHALPSPAWFLWTSSIVGFLLILAGSMGTCVELARRD